MADPEASAPPPDVDDGDDDDMLDDDNFGEDMLLNVLTTEDGDTITSVLANLASSTDAIAKHLEKQNVILVKILTALSAKAAASA